MPWPVVIAANGFGIPVTESDSELAIPAEIADNGYGTPVVLVDSGGTPVKGVGGGVTAPTAPVLTWVSANTDTTPEFTIDIDDTVAEGDTLTFQRQANGGDWSSPTETSAAITAGEDLANEISLALAALAAGDYEARCKVVVGGVSSAWSNVVDFDIAASLTTFDSSLITFDDNLLTFDEAA